jgi:uncharacterized protein (TIGR02246 family)
MIYMQPPPDKHESIEDCLERIRTAWNAGDAAAFAAQFTEDATYVIWSGDLLLGRSEIERVHIEALRRGTRMKIKVLSIKPLAEDVATVLTAGGVGKETIIRVEKLQTLTMVRPSARWMCAAFQNTDMSPRAKSLYNSEQ